MRTSAQASLASQMYFPKAYSCTRKILIARKTMAYIRLIRCYKKTLLYVLYPSCRHTILASVDVAQSSETVPQIPDKNIST